MTQMQISHGTEIAAGKLNRVLYFKNENQSDL